MRGMNLPPLEGFRYRPKSTFFDRREKVEDDKEKVVQGLRMGTGTGMNGNGNGLKGEFRREEVFKRDRPVGMDWRGEIPRFKEKEKEKEKEREREREKKERDQYRQESIKTNGSLINGMGSGVVDGSTNGHGGHPLVGIAALVSAAEEKSKEREARVA